MGDIRAEPSMEEILASIKRIIADDGLAVPGARPRFRMDASDSPIAPPAPEPVLELTEPVVPQADPTPPPAPLAPESAASAPIIATPAPSLRQPIAEPIAQPSPAAPHGETAATLVSEDAACASRQSLSALSSMVLRTPDSDNTLDGLVRELLRPMLKEWLDSHLPDLVETLVAREIARITGKAL